jgi:UDP-glucose 4-epimerase
VTSQKPRCLVTGGAGFIGSHLVDRLVAEGHDVVVIDNFHTGRLDNLDGHKGSGKVAIHQADIGDAAAIDPLFDGIDWVFHLAAMADIVPSIQNPLLYHRANTDGTFNVLQSARRVDCKRFIYIASSSCYGIPDVSPTPETAPARPMYPYALTKYVGEQYALHWAQTYKMPLLSLRFFNVFGPRHRTTGAYGAVFGVFLAQKLAGKPLTIVGDGTQTRDFTFVTDIVDAIVTAARSDVSGEVFNVGSGGTYSVNLLADLLGGERIHIPKRPGEPDCTFADIAKIRRMLGWEPKTAFADGVKVLLEDIESFRDAPVWTPEAIAAATADWFKYLTPTAA